MYQNDALSFTHSFTMCFTMSFMYFQLVHTETATPLITAARWMRQRAADEARRHYRHATRATLDHSAPRAVVPLPHSARRNLYVHYDLAHPSIFRLSVSQKWIFPHVFPPSYTNGREGGSVFFEGAVSARSRIRGGRHSRWTDIVVRPHLEEFFVLWGYRVCSLAPRPPAGPTLVGC